MRTTAVLLVHMPCSVLSCGLASDSDKFKFITTLRRALKFVDTEPYKYFDLLFNPNGTKWYDDVPGARSTRDGDTGNEDNSSFGFFKLDKYAMFSFVMTCGLASDSDKFKFITTLRQALKFVDTEPYKYFDFLFNPLMHDFYRNFSRNLVSFNKEDAMHLWVNPCTHLFTFYTPLHLHQI